MRTFAIIAGNEKFAFWDDEVDLAAGVFFRAVNIRDAPLSIINKAVGGFFIIDGHNAVFDGDAFAREGNYTLDDVLIADIRWYGAGHRVGDALLFIFGDFFLIFVEKDDDLPAFRDILLPDKVRPRNRGAIYNDTIVLV